MSYPEQDVGFAEYELRQALRGRRGALPPQTKGRNSAGYKLSNRGLTTFKNRPQVIALIALTLCVGGNPTTRAPGAPVAQAAPPELVSELGSVVERARQRFEARDAPGVLAHVSEQHRSGGLTKADLRQQLLAMFALYEVLRAGVTIGDVQIVDGAVWVYTSGEVSGRLPFLGWVTVLTWQNEPEVARREDAGWRLFGFQN